MPRVLLRMEYDIIGVAVVTLYRCIRWLSGNGWQFQHHPNTMANQPAQHAPMLLIWFMKGASYSYISCLLFPPPLPLLHHPNVIHTCGVGEECV